MNRKKNLSEKLNNLFDEFKELHQTLDKQFIKEFNRSLPLNETLLDRWDRAKQLGFGEGTSIYDSSFVFGDVKVGTNCWIGPNTIIDGSGGLKIGDYVTISVGVHIYSHDNVLQTLSSGKIEISRSSVEINNNSYIGPQSIISKGVKIGHHCVIAANSFVNKDVEDFSIVGGNPAKKIGRVVLDGDNIKFEYQT